MSVYLSKIVHILISPLYRIHKLLCLEAHAVVFKIAICSNYIIRFVVQLLAATILKAWILFIGEDSDIVATKESLATPFSLLLHGVSSVSLYGVQYIRLLGLIGSA